VRNHPLTLKGSLAMKERKRTFLRGNDGLEQDYMSRVALNFVLQSHLFYYTRIFSHANNR
jgi:hypothetical protein